MDTKTKYHSTQCSTDFCVVATPFECPPPSSGTSYAYQRLQWTKGHRNQMKE